MIDTDTPILPLVVAECAIAQSPHAHAIPREQWIALAQGLAAKAERHYGTNNAFRAGVQDKRGNAGRDYLFAFMLHWLDSWATGDKARRERLALGVL